MKNANFSHAAALLLTVAAIAIAPNANAAESKAVNDIQKTRLEFLENQTKGIDDIQKTRLEFLESQTKGINDIQKTRLAFLENQTKGVDDAWGDSFTGKTSEPTTVFKF